MPVPKNAVTLSGVGRVPKYLIMQQMRLWLSGCTLESAARLAAATDFFEMLQSTTSNLEWNRINKPQFSYDSSLAYFNA